MFFGKVWSGLAPQSPPATAQFYELYRFTILRLSKTQMSTYQVTSILDCVTISSEILKCGTISSEIFKPYILFFLLVNRMQTNSTAAVA
jgi:hypothetical protein